MATYAQLKKQIEQLAKQADAALRAEKDIVLAKVRDAVSSFSLSVEEVFGVTGKKKVKGARPAAPKRVPKGAGQAKYADPKTGVTWSGFGRAPAWIASAKDRTKFLVDQTPALVTSSSSKVGKTSAKQKAAPKTRKSPAREQVAKKSAVAAPTKKAGQTVAKASSKAKMVATKKAPAAAPKKAASTTSARSKKAAPVEAKNSASSPAAAELANKPAVTTTT